MACLIIAMQGLAQNAIIKNFDTLARCQLSMGRHGYTPTCSGLYFIKFGFTLWAAFHAQFLTWRKLALSFTILELSKFMSSCHEHTEFCEGFTKCRDRPKTDNSESRDRIEIFTFCKCIETEPRHFKTCLKTASSRDTCLEDSLIFCSKPIGLPICRVERTFEMAQSPITMGSPWILVCNCTYLSALVVWSWSYQILPILRTKQPSTHWLFSTQISISLHICVLPKYGKHQLATWQWPKWLSIDCHVKNCNQEQLKSFNWKIFFLLICGKEMQYQVH